MEMCRSAFIAAFSPRRASKSRTGGGSFGFDGAMPSKRAGFEPNELTAARTSEDLLDHLAALVRELGLSDWQNDALGRRERELVIQRPEAAKVIRPIKTDDPAGIEEYWHRRFHDRRKNGEWFELTAQDLATFRRRKFM